MSKNNKVAQQTPKPTPMPEQKEKTTAPAPVAQEQVEKLTAEVLHWKDLALRTAAEMENLRKRCALDMQNNTKYALKDFAKDVLPVVDNLESALKHARVEMGKLNEQLPPFFTGFFQGIEMTHKLLLGALEKHHVKQMQDVGTVFDPDRHQVIQQVEDPTKPNGTIIEQLQTGYLLQDRVLREAMVIVSKEPVQQ